jgi:hypothetical protein
MKVESVRLKLDHLSFWLGIGDYYNISEETSKIIEIEAHDNFVNFLLEDNSVIRRYDIIEIIFK